MDVIVVGAGVIGLTSAISLRRAGLPADILAAEPPEETAASAVAGAIWYPHKAGQGSREAGWGRTTLDTFISGVAGDLPGLSLRDMVELTLAGSPDPWWADPVRGYRRCRPDELRAGYTDGFVQETVTIDTIPHLAYLADEFASLGGSIRLGRIERLDDVDVGRSLIVNCSGVGAGELAGDESVHPIRGQVVRLRSDTVDRVTMVEEGPLAYAYVMPHGKEVVIGGTRDVGEWDRRPDDAVTRRLIEKASLLEPDLAGAPIVDVKVGLRPGREAVRLEHEAVAGSPGVIHNYGHAGNGWSLSWGCAEEVVRLAAAVA